RGGAGGHPGPRRQDRHWLGAGVGRGGRTAKLSVEVDTDTDKPSKGLKGFSSKAAGIAAGIASAGTQVALEAVATAAQKGGTYLLDARDNAGDRPGDPA